MSKIEPVLLWLTTDEHSTPKQATSIAIRMAYEGNRNCDSFRYPLNKQIYMMALLLIISTCRWYVSLPQSTQFTFFLRESKFTHIERHIRCRTRKIDRQISRCLRKKEPYWVVGACDVYHRVKTHRHVPKEIHLTLKKHKIREEKNSFYAMLPERNRQRETLSRNRHMFNHYCTAGGPCVLVCCCYDANMHRHVVQCNADNAIHWIHFGPGWMWCCCLNFFLHRFLLFVRYHCLISISCFSLSMHHKMHWAYATVSKYEYSSMSVRNLFFTLFLCAASVLTFYSSHLLAGMRVVVRASCRCHWEKYTRDIYECHPDDIEKAVTHFHYLD